MNTSNLGNGVQKLHERNTCLSITTFIPGSKVSIIGKSLVTFGWIDKNCTLQAQGASQKWRRHHFCGGGRGGVAINDVVHRKWILCTWSNQTQNNDFGRDKELGQLEMKLIFWDFSYLLGQRWRHFCTALKAAKTEYQQGAASLLCADNGWRMLVPHKNRSMQMSSKVRLYCSNRKLFDRFFGRYLESCRAKKRKNILFTMFPSKDIFFWQQHLGWLLFSY